MNEGVSTIDTEIKLSPEEIDTIGELLNISMGAAATAISVLLNKRVNITTPVVEVTEKEKFGYSQLEPAIGVEVNYIEGLHGSNLMIMNLRDVKVIVKSLVGDTGDVTEEELDELNQSVLGEIMNQMMGSASTALASFFNKTINISPPKVSEPLEFYDKVLKAEESSNIITVSFKFFVEGLVDNSFITVFPLKFAKELAESAMNMGNDETDVKKNEDDVNQIEDEEVVEVLDSQNDGDVVGHKQIPEVVMVEEQQMKENRGVSVQEEKSIEKELKEAWRAETDSVRSIKKEQTPPKRKEKKNVNVKNLVFENFDEESNENTSANDEKVNLDLVMDVELNISVEIGHAKKPVKDVINITKGSIIELDKQAGEPVDVIVNGQLIARGDVVVIDDNFGVRITQVIERN